MLTRSLAQNEAHNQAITTTQRLKGKAMPGKLTKTGLLAAVAILFGFSSPAGADPQGYIDDQEEVGFFYGTFEQSPNIALLVGGTAEEFCGELGTTPSRVFPRSDGSVDIKVNAKNQPIYLYEIEFDGVPPWLDTVCQEGLTPSPFATGTANLKVRVSVLPDDIVEFSNSVNGKATGIDGTEYKVRGWADAIVDGGILVGNPADFVGFELKEIRR